MTKIASILISFLLLVFVCRAQNNGGNVDYENPHWGFVFQYQSTEYKIYKKADWNTRTYYTAEGTIPTQIQNAQLTGIKGVKTPGFALGFVTDLRLMSHANLRLTPVLAFGERQMQYDYAFPDGKKESFVTKTAATTVDFPLGVKLNSDQVGNFRAYVLGGIKYSADITSSKKVNNEDKNEMDKLVKFNQKYLSWEAGLGFDFYFEYFRMSPEIKFTQSFNSVLDKTDKPNVYNQPLDKLFLRSFQFSLFFE